MTTQPYTNGQKVSVQLWDATEGSNRIGSPATVMQIRRGRSESGWLVTVVGTLGKPRVLCANWLKPYTS